MAQIIVCHLEDKTVQGDRASSISRGTLRAIGSLRLHLVQERPYGHDPNTLMLHELEEVGIASNDAIGPRCERGSENMIVIRISADAPDRGNPSYDDGASGQRRNERLHLCSDVAVALAIALFE
jgi:hypothetical protein